MELKRAEVAIAQALRDFDRPFTRNLPYGSNTNVNVHTAVHIYAYIHAHITYVYIYICFICIYVYIHTCILHIRTIHIHKDVPKHGPASSDSPAL